MLSKSRRIDTNPLVLYREDKQPASSDVAFRHKTTMT